MDPGARTAALEDKPLTLTRVEYDLLYALVRAVGRVCSREHLLLAVADRDFEAFDRSIDVHISRIRALIEDDPKNPRRVLTVRGAGYVFARKQDSDDAR